VAPSGGAIRACGGSLPASGGRAERLRGHVASCAPFGILSDFEVVIDEFIAIPDGKGTIGVSDDFECVVFHNDITLNPSLGLAIEKMHDFKFSFPNRN
jgi:hypothetical protein